MGESTDLLQQGKAIQQLEDANKNLAAENEELRSRTAWWFVIGVVLLGLYAGYRLGLQLTRRPIAREERGLANRLLAAPLFQPPRLHAR